MRTWFITGVSRGLGRAIAQAALTEGDTIIGTIRDAAPDLAAGPGKLHVVTLDVTDGEAVDMAVAQAFASAGTIDVIVNNAGYASLSPIETGDDEDFRAQFETNFWGVYNVSKAAIPVLREQGGGLIMQFSSMGGRVGGSPGIASYQAAKFAIDGFSRVLRTETAPFGIKVIVVEPSGFRTDWAGSSMTVRPVPEEYAEILTWRGEGSGVAAGDPDRAAEILVQVAKRRDIPRNLPLGVNATEGSIRLDEERLDEDRKWSAVGRSADFAESYPVEFPEDI